MVRSHFTIVLFFSFNFIFVQFIFTYVFNFDFCIFCIAALISGIDSPIKFQILAVAQWQNECGQGVWWHWCSWVMLRVMFLHVAVLQKIFAAFLAIIVSDVQMDEHMASDICLHDK